ncbi:MAG: hypothetical protein N2490_01205 [Ignavibacteria bacterium]|nr:hypothetical protein [Ignavibacteria bacterium]
MKEKIFDIVSKVVENSDLMLIDIHLRGERKNYILEIFIDSKDKLDFDVLTDMNNKIWDEIVLNRLDNEFSKFIVSSPGVDRPFKYFDQLYKHIGKDLIIKMKDGSNLTGKLIGLNDKDTKNELIIEFENVEKEKNTIAVEFNQIQYSKVKLKF